MNRVTQGSFPGPRDEAGRNARNGDTNMSVERARMTRRRWVGVVSLAVALLAMIAALALRQSATVEGAGPNPENTLVPSGPSQLLPPLCSDAAFRTGRVAPYDDDRPCADALPTGTNYGVVTAGHLYRDVAVDIPARGWKANPLQGSIEIMSPGGDGVTVVAHPSLAAMLKRHSRTGRAMLAQIRDLADVEVLDSGTTSREGNTFTWIDLAVGSRAHLSDDCRLEAPCLPLVEAPMVKGAAVELHPDRVSRLIVGGGIRRNVPVAIWVHDVTAPDAAAAIHVADSLTLGIPHE